MIAFAERPVDGNGAPREWERVVGRLRGTLPGPTLIVLGGLHGNEPAGLLAALRVLRSIETGSAALRGEFIVLAGNRDALARGQRYVQRDLNRQWTPDRIETLRRKSRSSTLAGEDLEQLDLLDSIESIAAGARGDAYFVDLHTTSADGYPFSMIADSPDQRAFALQFQLPIVTGLFDRIDGVLLSYLRRRGFLTMGVEGGQNESRRSVDHHEAVIWIALAAAGLVPPGLLPDLGRYHDRLEAARGPLPRIMEVVRRHAIRAEDDFRMEPGFANIHPIENGQLLARDRRGEIRAAEAGLVIMPLYQTQGDDGFFWGRAISAD